MAGKKHFGTLYLANLRAVFFTPVFFIVFAFVYDPFRIQDFYEIGGKSFTFHFTMLFCIMLVWLALTRLLLSLIEMSYDVDGVNRAVWSVLEIFSISCFTALYTTLFYGDAQNFFQSLSFCVRNSYTILVFPYLLFWFLDIIARKNNELLSGPSDTSLLKLYDEHHRLKLTIDPKAILYCQAESNYYKVCYLEGERIKGFLIRNSMKSLEEPAGRHGIVRCHRSYYVNPVHIKVLRKDKDGFMYADLNQEDAMSIPVSKSYFASLSKLL